MNVIYRDFPDAPGGKNLSVTSRTSVYMQVESYNAVLGVKIKATGESTALNMTHSFQYNDDKGTY